MIRYLLLLTIFFNLYETVLVAQQFNTTESFYPNRNDLDKEDITYGYLTIPENWDSTNDKTVEMATVIIKNKTKRDTNKKAILYLEGGPGANGINFMEYWLSHPVREQHDVVLIDIRGVGLSKPRLCPDLGKTLFKIFASDHTREEDEAEKVEVTLKCRDDILQRGIDLTAYNSKTIVKDLNALRTTLGYDSWHLYAVSYGTHIAQVYANDFPDDVSTMILDSTIPDISTYLTQNTTNYIRSLNKVFASCKMNPPCNEAYPDLKQKYYNTVKDIKAKPIKVTVDKNVISEGTFTYNAEDFKIAIHQALYNKHLVDVIPLLIQEFSNRNEVVLSKLLPAFSGAINLDYGVYYCISCNEVIPENPIKAFEQDAAQNPSMGGGLSFYKSDYKVCEKWLPNSVETVDSAFIESGSLIPVLVFSGRFDPITPPENAKQLVHKYKNTVHTHYKNAGHVPGFGRKGRKLVAKFLNESVDEMEPKYIEYGNDKKFVNDIQVHPGVVNMAESLNPIKPLFFVPLIIAILIMLFVAISYSISFFRQKKEIMLVRLLKLSVIISSCIGIFTLTGFVLAIKKTAQFNYYVLIFGLPSSYDYLYSLAYILVVIFIIEGLLFILTIRKSSKKMAAITAIFSLLIILIYFKYWDLF